MKRPQRIESRPTYEADCPFCAGNESMTPRELHREPEDSEGSDWRVRVVLNKYPMLALDDPGLAQETDGLFRATGAGGVHDVIIESPRHDAEYTDLDAEGVLAIWRTYRARFGAVTADAATRHVVIFRNHGPMANASLPHLHSQLVALRFVPPAIEAIVERSRAHFRSRSRRALLTDVLEAEIDNGARIVCQDGNLVSFVPFAAAHDYEVWIASREAPGRFDEVSDAELARVGKAVRHALGALASVLDAPDYNMVLQTPPLVDGADEVLPWFVRIIPRLAAGAGLELGTGLDVISVAPESAAAELRAAIGPRRLDNGNG